MGESKIYIFTSYNSEATKTTSYTALTRFFNFNKFILINKKKIKIIVFLLQYYMKIKNRDHHCDSFYYYFFLLFFYCSNKLYCFVKIHIKFVLTYTCNTFKTYYEPMIQGKSYKSKQYLFMFNSTVIVHVMPD